VSGRVDPEELAAWLRLDEEVELCRPCAVRPIRVAGTASTRGDVGLGGGLVGGWPPARVDLNKVFVPGASRP